MDCKSKLPAWETGFAIQLLDGEFPTAPRYAEAIPAGVRLRAEAQLRQAAQLLASDSFVPAKDDHRTRGLQIQLRPDLSSGHQNCPEFILDRAP